jgi:hypothetical protein
MFWPMHRELGPMEMEIGGESVMTEEDRVKEIEAQIDDLKKRWPAHSVPPNMLMRLDELEEELEEASRALAGRKGIGQDLQH